MSAPGNAHARLGNALITYFDATIESSWERPWASATFTGARHRFVLLTGGPLKSGLAAIGDHEFSLPGHLVADIAVREIETDAQGQATLSVEALTVES